MRLMHFAAALVLPAALAGCASTSVLTPYPAQAQAWRQSLDAGRPDATLAALAARTKSADGLLYQLERGRIDQLAGNADASRADFDGAIAAFEHEDERARISVSELAGSGASLLTNDNARPYTGHPYERVFVHQYQALNYLAAGDESGALVEVRRANQIQVQEREKRDNMVDSARSEAEGQGLRQSDYDGFFSSMDLAAGRVQTGFQNAATFYLSGLIYEATGSPNDAYIDYRKALELEPDNIYLKKDVVRTGLAVGLDDARKLAQKLGNVVVGPRGDEGEVVVYVEEGYVPEKRQVSVPILTERTLNHVSFPVYPQTPPPFPVSVQIDGRYLQAALLVDTRALAVRTLKDEIPGMVARAFLRLLTKQRMQRRMQDQNPLLGLATTLYSLVTDQADLRSWLTLPGSGQVVRLPLSPGEHSLSLPGLAPLAIPIRTGRPTLVHLVVLPGKTYSRIYPL
jgi:hypothetical protein